MDIYEQLYNNHYRAMLSYAYTILYDEDEAQDVVQDVWTRLLQKGVEIDPDRAAVFLKRSVHNECVNHVMHLKVEERMARLLPLEMDYILSDDEISQREEQWDRVEQFISTELTPKTQKILNMRYVDKLSYRDMASQLGVSTSAISKHLTQALSRLRDAFRTN